MNGGSVLFRKQKKRSKKKDQDLSLCVCFLKEENDVEYQMEKRQKKRATDHLSLLSGIFSERRCVCSDDLEDGSAVGLHFGWKRGQ